MAAAVCYRCGVTYRDDADAALARADALEKELAAAKAEIDELKGRRSEALTRVGSQALARQTATRWLGGPTRLALSRTIDGELPEEAYSDLVGRCTMLLGQIGNVSVLKGSLSWTSTIGSGNMISVFVTSRDKQTTIRIDENLGRVVGGVFGGVGGGVGGGGISLPILLATQTMPFLAPITIAGWLGGVYVLCRRIYRGVAQRHSERLYDLLEQLVEVASSKVQR